MLAPTTSIAKVGAPMNETDCGLVHFTDEDCHTQRFPLLSTSTATSAGSSLVFLHDQRYQEKLSLCGEHHDKKFVSIGDINDHITKQNYKINVITKLNCDITK